MAAKHTGDGPQLQLNPSQALVACLQRCSLPQSLLTSHRHRQLICHLLSTSTLSVTSPVTLTC